MDSNNQDQEDNFFKESLHYFSKFYNSMLTEELPDFIHKDEKTRSKIIDDIYAHNSKLEGLLREIQDEDMIIESTSEQ